MIIFLGNTPKENETITTTDCMNGERKTYTVKRHRSSQWYSDTWRRNITRYWLEAIDSATGEMFTSEYELLDNTDTTVVSSFYD